MGFSVTIAGIIVVSLLFTTALSLIALQFMVGKFIMNEFKRKGDIESYRIASLMTIRQAYLLSDNTTLEFILSNNGSIPLLDFKEFDLIITYTDHVSSIKKTILLKYRMDWRIVEFIVNGGYVYPYREGDSLLPSMSILVRAELPSQADPTQPVKIIMVNNYGGKAYYVFLPG